MPTRFLLQLVVAFGFILAATQISHALPPCTGPGITGICSCTIPCNSVCMQHGEPTTCGHINICAGHCAGAARPTLMEQLLAAAVPEKRDNVCTANDDEGASDDEDCSVQRAPEPPRTPAVRAASAVAASR
jgi:hypothetical protein